MSSELLVVENLHAFYGKSHVLQGVTLAVRPGEAVGLLGRNGVGKTTTLKAIMGLLVRRGAIRFNGRDVSSLPPHAVPRLGIGYVPQGRHIFPRLTVLENLAIGLVKESRVPADRLEAIFGHFPILRVRLNQLGGTLSGGEQQMLAFARAAITRPALILMDEPSEGLSPVIVASLRERIKAIQASGVGILLVEQSVKLALSICERVYFMEKGLVQHEATAAQLQGNEALVSRYLGVKS